MNFFDLKDLCYGPIEGGCCGKAVHLSLCEKCLCKKALNLVKKKTEKDMKTINNIITKVGPETTMAIIKASGVTNGGALKLLTLLSVQHKKKGTMPCCERCSKGTFIKCFCGGYPE
jgi:hypothetical protein